MQDQESFTDYLWREACNRSWRVLISLLALVMVANLVMALLLPAPLHLPLALVFGAFLPAIKTWVFGDIKGKEPGSWSKGL